MLPGLISFAKGAPGTVKSRGGPEIVGLNRVAALIGGDEAGTKTSWR